MAAAPPLWRRTRSSGRAERFGHVRERARCTGLTSMSPDREVSVSMPDGLFCRALRGGVLFFQPRAPPLSCKKNTTRRPSQSRGRDRRDCVLTKIAIPNKHPFAKEQNAPHWRNAHLLALLNNGHGMERPQRTDRGSVNPPQRRGRRQWTTSTPRSCRCRCARRPR